jgi:hypothetical protein
VNGAVVTDFAFDTDIANAIAVRPDGRIVAGAAHGSRFADRPQYLSTGSPDGAFGVGGKTVVDLVRLRPRLRHGAAAGRQGDARRIRPARRFRDNTTDMAVVRLDTAGQPDATFAPGGGVVLRLGDDSTNAVGIAQQADGKLVVAGWLVTPSNDGKFFIARLGGTCGNGVIDAPEQCDDGTPARSTAAHRAAAGSVGRLVRVRRQRLHERHVRRRWDVQPRGPRSICRAVSAPRKAKLAITDNADPTRDKLEFKWTKGVIPRLHGLRHPDAVHELTSCACSPVPAPRRRWSTKARSPRARSGRRRATSTSTRNKTGANDGFLLGQLQAPFGHPAKVVLKAKGANVAPPAPALATPVTAQLVNSSGECFGATFATPSV